MKKICLILTLALTAALCGCGEQPTQLQHGRDQDVKVILKLPNGEIIEGCPDWYCIEGYSQVSVMFDGVVYITGTDNIAIIE